MNGATFGSLQQQNAMVSTLHASGSVMGRNIMFGKSYAFGWVQDERQWLGFKITLLSTGWKAMDGRLHGSIQGEMQWL